MSIVRRAIHHAQNLQFILEKEAQWEAYRPYGGLPEQNLIEWSRQFLDVGDVFLDVGSHCGTWALQHASSTTPVFAYEAQWSTFCKLCGGIALNRLDAHVVATHAAVTDCDDGFADFHVVGDEGGGSSLSPDAIRDAVIRVETVQLRSLDSERERFRARGRVGLIKIDVEGAELSVLRGAQRLIAEDQPYLLVECWDNAERAKLFDFVEHVLEYQIIPVINYKEMWVFQPRAPRPRGIGITVSRLEAHSSDKVDVATQPTEPTLLDRAPSAIGLWGGTLHEFAQHLPPPTTDIERLVHHLPSVCADGDELWVSIRWINYQNDKEGWVCWDDKGVIRSVPECLRLEPDSLRVIERRPLRLSESVRALHPACESWTRGFEDLRLVRLPDGWAATATATDWNTQSRCEMFLLRFDVASQEGMVIDRVDKLVVPPGVNPFQHQKNWVPLHDAGEGSFSYVYKTGVLIYGDGSCAGPVDDEPVAVLRDLRGSSQALAIPAALGGGWIYVGHHDHAPPMPHLPHTVTHRLVWLDSSKRTQKASPRFSFLAPGVEYCAGLTLFRDELLFSFAVWERQLWIYRVPIERVLNSLVPCSTLED